MKRSIVVLMILLLVPLFAFGAGAKEGAAMAGQVGGSVSVLGVWGGQELDIFNAMVKPFTDATGVKVEFTGTRDINAVLTTEVAAGNPPDIAGLPGPVRWRSLPVRASWWSCPAC